jgi:hypothetical protein
MLRRTHTKPGCDYIIKRCCIVFSMGLASQGPRAPIYSDGAQRHSAFNSLMMWQPYQDTVRTCSVRSLSVTGSTGMSAAGLMTPFQSLSFSGGGGISMQGQVLYRHSAPVGRYVTTNFVPRCSRMKIPVVLSHYMERASVSQAEGCRFSTLCSSITPTF